MAYGDEGKISLSPNEIPKTVSLSQASLSPTQTLISPSHGRSLGFIYNIKGVNGFIDITLYDDAYKNFSKESHTYTFNSDKEIIFELIENDSQDTYLKPLIDKIKSTSSDPDYQAKVAISLVQHIPYDYYNTRMTDWYYPYETLYLGRGICSDKSILLGYILNKLGYDVALLQFDEENHMALGVKTSPEYDYLDSGYAFVETTQTSIITDSTEDFISGTELNSYPRIIPFNGGTKSLNVTEEYADAATLNYLESIGSKSNQTLSYTNYNRWYELSEKYDLFYELDHKV